MQQQLPPNEGTDDAWHTRNYMREFGMVNGGTVTWQNRAIDTLRLWTVVHCRHLGGVGFSGFWMCTSVMCVYFWMFTCDCLLVAVWLLLGTCGTVRCVCYCVLVAVWGVWLFTCESVKCMSFVTVYLCYCLVCDCLLCGSVKYVTVYVWQCEMLVMPVSV